MGPVEGREEDEVGAEAQQGAQHDDLSPAPPVREDAPRYLDDELRDALEGQDHPEALLRRPQLQDVEGLEGPPEGAHEHGEGPRQGEDEDVPGSKDLPEHRQGAGLLLTHLIATSSTILTSNWVNAAISIACPPTRVLTVLDLSQSMPSFSRIIPCLLISLYII